MGYSFNVFSGTLDQVGSSGAVVFEGEVETFADLPEVVGDPPVGSSYLVRTSTGVWLVNRRQAGIWIRRNNTGVRATDWEYGGDYPVNSVAGKTGNVTLTNSDISGLGSAATANLNAISDADLRIVGSTDSTKKVAIEVDTNVPTNTVVTLTAPSSGGTIARTSDIPTTFAASAITSGVLNNARVNFAAPPAIGAQTPNTGAFTNLSAASRLNLPSSGDTLNDIWVSGGQVRYQSGIQVTSARTLLTAEDNLSTLTNAATARANLGLGTAATANLDALSDSAFRIADNGDATKKLAFELSGISTGATRTLTVPDASGTIALTSDIPAAFDPASPGTIGGTTPAAATFTNLTANTRVNLPNTNGTTAGDIYRNANTLRYRDSTNTERLLLNATDNLSNLANTATARTNIGLGSADSVTFGSIQNTPIGSTTPAAGSFSTLSANNGTLTASAPALTVQQTWNDSAANFVGASIEITNTNNTNNSSSAFRVRVGGTDAIRVDRFRDVIFGANMQMGAASSAQVGQLRLAGFVNMVSPSVGAIDMREGASPCDFRIYGQYTSASNFERLSLKYNSTATAFQIGTEKGSGGGAARALQLQVDGTTRFSISAAGALALGSVITVWENTAGMYISNNAAGINFNNGLGISANGGIEAGSGGRFRWKDNVLYTSGSYDLGFQRNSAGVLEINNGTAGTFRDVVVRMLDVGGTTNAFPALKNSSTTLQVRLANDSDFAPLECAGLTLNGNLTASTRNIVTDTTTGTRIGTGTTQLLGFWNAAPSAQPAAVADATDAATVITQLNALLSRLRTIGIIAT